MTTRRTRYLRHRFPPDIISYAVRVYHRYCLSFGDVEDLLAERGILVSYETVRQWCRKFGPDYARRFLHAHGAIQNLFRVGRHHLRAVHHRLLRARAFTVWTAVTAG
jgi:transposase-like protein